MRVGFDAHMVGQRETGNETYALGLLQGFERIGFALDVYSFVSALPSLHRIHHMTPPQSVIRVPLTTPLLSMRDQLELFHATYVLPPVMPCPTVVTVHDITFALHPEWFTARVRTMLGTLVPRAMHAASMVITISQNTKQDIIERYEIAPEKIAVTYLAPRPVFGQLTEPVTAGEPFFLFVGNVEPRKNVETVIEALKLLSDRGMEAPLVIVGKPGLHHQAVSRLVYRLGVDHLVRFAGYVPDEQLRRLYATCTALVHPALYEGFGITPLEAMVQGAPVLVANTSSLPEVVDKAALLLDPYDVEAWADAIDRVAHDADMRADLRARGLERSQLFSWERCAHETVRVYERVMQDS